MDLAFGTSKPYGSSRSLVRRIAASLPIRPFPRVHFQLYPYTQEAGLLFSTRRQNGPVASLADISQIDKDEDNERDYFDTSEPGLPSGLMFRTQKDHFQRKLLTRQRSLPNLLEGTPNPQGLSVANDEAIQKISALEAELAKLREQIAQIILAQERSAQQAAGAQGTPSPPPLSGSITPPSPPPPPPLPPPTPSLQRTFSAIDLIRERRGKRKDRAIILDPRPVEIPNMLEILKDLDKVKLRSVTSRTIEVDAKGRYRDPVDAAALIAEALKRKFAHRQRRDSDAMEEFILPVKEVQPQTETPEFGQHILKATGKRELL